MDERPTQPGLEGLTLAEKRDLLARLLRDRAASRSAPAAATAILPGSPHRYDPFPLTDIQHAYWLGRMRVFDLGNVGTHVYVEFETPDLDIARMNAAWRKIVARHDMLRTVVRPDGTQQTLPEVPPYEIDVRDLRGLEPAEADRILLEHRYRQSHHVFAVDEWPLFHVRSFRLDGNRFHHCLGIDLIIADLMSLQIMLDELFTLYADLDAQLEPLTITFRDYILASAGPGAPGYERSKSYWWDRLETLAPAPALPMAGDPGALRQYRFVRRTDRLTGDAWARLKSRARQHGLTPAAVLLAAFGEVLATWTASRRFTINLTLFSREPIHPQIGRVVGDFTSTNLLAMDVNPALAFTERALTLQGRLWSDIEHRAISGVRVMRELARRYGRDRASMPVVFTCDLARGISGEEASTFTIPLPVDLKYGISQTPQVYLDHQVFEEAGSLLVNWDAVEALFPDGLLDTMFAANMRLLQRLADEDVSWSERGRCLTPKPELAQRETVNATQALLPTGRLHELFLEQANARPDAAAVLTPDRSLTYAEVEMMSARLGRLLQDQGAVPNSLVAVVMEKGWEQVVATLGVLRSGAAYVPIDPELPTQRLWQLLEDSGSSLVLTQPWLAADIGWPNSSRTLVVGDSLAQDRHAPAPDDVGGILDLCYVIYTSGSTGKPKGVAISHSSAVNTIADINRRFRVGARDRVLGLSSLSFDLSVYDIFGILAAGGAVVLPSAGAGRDPEEWVRLVRAHRVTIWNTVPALAQMLLDYVVPEDETLGHLRLAMLSGDWIPVGMPGRFRACVPGIEVASLGGATEASIWSTVFPIGEVDPQWTSIPYGRPMTNQTMLVLDEGLSPRPVWVPGELYIGGAGVATGYWHEPEKTAESFLDRGTERLYRTGDIARYLPDGCVEFLGRRDNQVKIRGHRVELGEIEAILEQCPGVGAAVAVAVGEERDRRHIVCYIVPGDGFSGPLFEVRQASAGAERAAAQAYEVAVAHELPSAQLETSRSMRELLDEMSVQYMWRTLQELGVFVTPGQVRSIDQLIHCGISPRYRDIIARWLDELVTDGALARTVSGDYVALGNPAAVDVGPGLSALAEQAARWPAGLRLLELFKLFGEELPSILKGNSEPVDLLFSGGSLETADALYRLNPTADYLNDVVRQAVAAFVRSSPDRHVRLLEVGAGTGATTAAVLPELPEERTTYLFTDVSKFFLNNATERFESFGFITYGTLDINRDPVADGYEPYSTDIVIASNVLHNAADLQRTLGYLRGLLTPRGLLLLVELQQSRVEMVTVGLLQAVQTDDATRTDGPGLRSPVEWVRALERAGFERPTYLPKSDGTGKLPAHVIMAVAPSVTRSLDHARVRDFLKDRLPSYMVPDDAHLLPALPLTPNGKVDRKALASLLGPAARRVKSTEYVAPRNPTEESLAKLWEDALGVSPVGVHDNFFDLGGDSLVAIELLADASAKGVTLNPAAVFEHQTIADLAAFLTGSAPARESHPHLVELRRGSSRPLFCVHPSTGNVDCYLALARSLGSGQSVFGIRAAGLEGRDMGEAGLRDLAASYVSAIKAVQAEGPYQLLGWSMGGVLAFEMACQIVTAGGRVELLAVVDQQPWEPDAAVSSDEFMVDQLALAGVPVPAEPGVTGPGGRLDKAIEAAQDAGLLPQRIGPEVIERTIELARANITALRHYRPDRYPGDVVLFRAADGRSAPDLGWGEVARSVTVVAVPGTHFSLLREPSLSILTRDLIVRLSP